MGDYQTPSYNKVLIIRCTLYSIMIYSYLSTAIGLIGGNTGDVYEKPTHNNAKIVAADHDS